MPIPNNYFRVQGTMETFTFDDSSPESVESALAEAQVLAHRLRTVRGIPTILVWRKAPSVGPMPVVGEPLDRGSFN